MAEQQISCLLRSLPHTQEVAAAAVAVAANPVNAVPSPGLARFGIVEPMRIALLTSRYWGKTLRTLRVRFVSPASSSLRSRILSHMNAWYHGGSGVRFVQTTGHSDVRITLREEGYWSYLGTDILHIPQEEPTLCLQDFSLRTPDSEYARVVRHETGHTLGFPHEHMRREIVQELDVRKTIDYFARYQGWDEQTTRQQVLTPLEDRAIIGTPADKTSIMCYQLPGAITVSGRPIPGGLDIDSSDQQFANKIYPRVL